MNDFDRRLEAELARMLDPVAKTPAPPRRRRPRGRPVLKLFSPSELPTARVVPILVLAEAPAELRVEAAASLGVPPPQPRESVAGLY
jgi:hypothetical protein